MKTHIRILLAISLCIVALSTFSQEPPHPNNGQNPGTGNTPVGSNAPIESGLGVLVIMAAAYASRSLKPKKIN